MRVRSREHLGGEFDSILTSCFVVSSRCSLAWTGFAAIHAVSVIVLQGAGLFCLPCIGKDQIKSVPSNKTSVSASRRFRFVPVLDIIKCYKPCHKIKRATNFAYRQQIACN